MRNGTPEASMRCFARLMRCAIVASPTRNALAISAVVSPPTARSVRAIAEAGVSAGWQHMKSRISVSSWSGISPADAPSSEASSRDRRERSLRHWSIRRRDAVWTSQPRGSSGTPSRGQRVAAARSAS